MLTQILNAGSGKMLRHLHGITAQVNIVEDDFRALSDAELREETDRFKARLEDGQSLDHLMPEAFAAVRETSRRVLGKRHHDVQIMGGAALHLGNVAQISTGEGKTLIATLPSYLNALTGRGVHVVTVNDFLAREQAEQMSRIHHALGLTVGCLTTDLKTTERQGIYAADITYGTNTEFGFDYLRDNLSLTRAVQVQRGHHYAIVDEIDSILVDDARTPLLIAQASEHQTTWFYHFDIIIDHLIKGEDEDYVVDEVKRTVALTEKGIDHIEDLMGIENLYAGENASLTPFINLSIQARELFKNGKDYVVSNGEVKIVDQLTGRILDSHRYSGGVHQAIEAKEGVTIKAEDETSATVTLQNYFRMYDKLSGMTGTAYSEAREFHQVYGMDVIDIPDHRPNQRIEHPDLVFNNEKDKFNAVVKHVSEIHATGQPVLIGTTSVRHSELMSHLLDGAGIAHSVLNAKYIEQEASIVAQAGRRGAVTVATNMAGRGTDILLGGSAEHLATERMHMLGYDALVDDEAYEKAWPDVLAAAEAEVSEARKEIEKLGGLFVIGTERHASRRIDDQLKGRSARQGDPGASMFYVSFEDDVLAKKATMLPRHASCSPEGATSKTLNKAVSAIQIATEDEERSTRKEVLKYDDILDRQRKAVYSLRGQIMDMKAQDFIERLTTKTVSRTASTLLTPTGFDDEETCQQFIDELMTVYPCTITVESIQSTYGDVRTVDVPQIIEDFASDMMWVYRQSTNARQVGSVPILQALDEGWRSHLNDIEVLKDGITLRSFSGRTPIDEFERDSVRIFEEMMLSFLQIALTRVFADLSFSGDLTSIDDLDLVWSSRRARRESQRRHDEMRKTHASRRRAASRAS